MMIRHGGPVELVNTEGVCLGSFPDKANALAWINDQNARSELFIRTLVVCHVET